MASYVYADGKYHILAGNKIVNNGSLLTMKDTDRIVANRIAYPLGVSSVVVKPPVVPDIPDFPEIPEPTLTSLTHEQGVEPTTGTTYYVTPSGSGDRSGSSWENAMDLQGVHIQLLSIGSGNRFYFMEGLYQLDRPFEAPDNTSFYGGFSTESPSWETRDAFNHGTVFNLAFEVRVGASLYTYFVSGTDITVDGFVMSGLDIPTSGTSVSYVNMTFRSGIIRTTKHLQNCYIYDCDVYYNTMQSVIISNRTPKPLSGYNSVAVLQNVFCTNCTVSQNSSCKVIVNNCYFIDCLINIDELNNSIVVGTAGTNAFAVNVSLAHTCIVSTDNTVHGSFSNSHIRCASFSGSVTESTIYGSANLVGTTPSSDFQVYGHVTTNNISNGVIHGDVTLRWNSYNETGYISGSVIYGNVSLFKDSTARYEMTDCHIYGDVSGESAEEVLVLRTNIHGSVNAPVSFTFEGDTAMHNMIGGYCTMYTSTFSNYVVNGVSSTLEYATHTLSNCICLSGEYNHIKSISKSTLLNCSLYPYYVEPSITDSYCINVSISVSDKVGSSREVQFTNSVLINSVVENGRVWSNYTTLVNTMFSLFRGYYNVLWNNDTHTLYPNNADSEFSESNLLTLGYDNSIARFKNTGFAPARGIQDVGQPPSPITDSEGYQAWIDQFGNFQPASNSFLKGLAPLDPTITDDIDGTVRLDPTTPGAYETETANG